MKKLNPELIERAEAVKAARAARTAELLDDELDNVSGGAGAVDNWHTCPHFICCFCYAGKTDPQEQQHSCKENGGEFVESVCSLCNRAVWQTNVGWVCSL